MPPRLTASNMLSRARADSIGTMAHPKMSRISSTVFKTNADANANADADANANTGSHGHGHGHGHDMNADMTAMNNDIKATARSVVSEQDTEDLTKHHDVIMRRWKLQAFVQMHLHHDSHYFYRTVYSILSVPLIMLTTASSATIFSSDNTAVRYVVASMNIVATILAGLIWQFQPAELSQQHSMLSQRYRILSHSLESAMKTPKCMRAGIDNFMKNIQNEMDVLIRAQVDPPSIVLNKHRKIFGPMNAILYGDDVVAALVNNVKTSTMVSMINDRSKRVPQKWSRHAGKLFDKVMMDSSDPEVDLRQRRDFDSFVVRMLEREREENNHNDRDRERDRDEHALNIINDFCNVDNANTSEADARKRERSHGVSP